MRWLSEQRGQLILEDPRLRLGVVRFVPQSGRVGRSQQRRSEMSEDTFQLLLSDEALARTYTVTRAKAMRSNQGTMLSLLGKATPPIPVADEAVSLSGLEDRMGQLFAAMQAIADPSEFGSTDLMRRRQQLRTELLAVERRVAGLRGQLDVIDELLEAKVLT